MLMLGIDTSGKTASAALYEDGIMLGQTSVYTSKTHSQVILPMVKKIMSDCGRELSQLTDISVSSGPGSYTGIRIGIAAVKAMSFALDIPCYAVSSLEGLAYNCGFIGYICPVMKARKDLVYTALYRIDKDKLVRCTDEFKNAKYVLSPVHLRLQNGSGICIAALHHTPQTADEIEASYLQLVKAEKDLIKSGHC